MDALSLFRRRRELEIENRQLRTALSFDVDLCTDLEQEAINQAAKLKVDVIDLLEAAEAMAKAALVQT
jgi:hypothetical protein